MEKLQKKLSQVHPIQCVNITGAARIIGFRNRLAHEYATASNEIAWGITGTSISVLSEEIARLSQQEGLED